MKQLGEYLKSIRINKKLTIEQASIVTKISKSTLIAIEDADSTSLPAKSYLRGFVFSYGKFLGADPEKVTQLFTNEIGSTNPEIKHEDITKETWKTVPFMDKIQFNSKTYIVAGLAVLTIAAIFTQKVFQKYQTETILPPQPVVQEPIKAQEVQIPSKQSKNVLPQKLSAKKPAAINTERAALLKFPKELLIEAQEDTDLKIKIGQEKEKRIKLLKGDFHTIKAKSKVMLETANIKDIKVIYNGTLHTANKNEIKSKVLNF